MKFRPYLLLVAVCAILATVRASVEEGSSSSSAPKNPTSAQHSAPNPAGEQNSYRNSTFGFRYDVILGWVDRTNEMQPGQKPGVPPSGGQGKVLLGVFERPPEVSNDSINSGVVIAQESAASYPGLKTAADYVAPLTELATRNGFKVAGDPSEITIDSRALVECDFMRESGKVPAYQSTLILLQKGMIVSFTFIGANADEVKDLMERLSFQRPAAGKQK